MFRIMLVDDEENILKSINRTLSRNTADWEVECYGSAREALKRAQSTVFDVFVSDYRMPEMNGVEFLVQIKELQPESMRIILSGYAELEALMGAINDAEIFRFISKPWNDEDLIKVVQQAVKFRKMYQENKYLAQQVREKDEEIEILKSTST